MVIRPALVAFALAAALLAVGVGAYLAVRQNETAAVAAVSAGEAPAVDATERVVATEQVVEATEQVVEAPPTPRELAPSATTVQRAPAAPAAPVRAEAAVRPPPAARAAATDAPAPRDARAAAAGAGDPPNPRAPAVGARASAPDPAPDVPPGTGRPPRTQPRARTPPRVEGWERADGSRADGSRADGGRTADAARPVDAGSAERAAEASAAAADRERRPAARELVIEADSVIGLQVDSFVTTETAEVEDEVHARVTRDVLVTGEVAIPAGAVALGSVTLVERAGRVQGASRLGVRFHTVVLDDGSQVPVVTETVYRESGSGGGERAARIGGAAVGGAILGAIFGGRRGAAIGGAAGAGTGAVAALASQGEPAILPYGSTLTVRLSRPAVFIVPR